MKQVLDIPAELSGIQNWVLAGLVQVTDEIEAALASDVPAVADLCKQVEQFRGKMLRPTLVLVSGAACGISIDEPPPADLLKLAAVVEMVHMATLVHDDVLDEAEIRRRAQTINDKAGNESAVLLGDYLIAASFRLCASLGDPEPSRLIGKVSMELCEGELLQLQNRDNLSIDEPTYYEILEGKTAALVGACTRLGSRAGGGDENVQNAMDSFGRAIGVAFQVQDDLLDLLGNEEVVGKSLGRDLKKGKLTLPLIHHLASLEPESRAASLTLLEEASETRGNGAPANTRQLIESLRSTGSLDYSRDSAESLISRAKDALTVLEQTPARSVLELLADAVLTRDR
ncbi:MAG: polyprenyl synthetase family protein [Phycisphaerales bacterium]